MGEERGKQLQRDTTKTPSPLQTGREQNAEMGRTFGCSDVSNSVSAPGHTKTPKSTSCHRGHHQLLRQNVYRSPHGHQQPKTEGQKPRTGESGKTSPQSRRKIQISLILTPIEQVKSSCESPLSSDDKHHTLVLLDVIAILGVFGDGQPGVRGHSMGPVVAVVKFFRVHASRPFSWQRTWDKPAVIIFRFPSYLFTRSTWKEQTSIFPWCVAFMETSILGCEGVEDVQCVMAG